MSESGYHALQAERARTFEQALTNLNDQEQPLSRRAMAALSNLDDKQFAAFQAVWQRIGSERRVEAIHTLLVLAEENVDVNFRRIFLDCLDAPEATVRAVAVDGLWEDENPRTMRRFIALLNDPASEVRVAAVLNLSRFAYRAALDELSYENQQAVCTALLNIMTDEGQPLDVQRRAIEALGYFADSPAAQTQVGHAYEHRSQRMRESAIVAMGRSMRPEWFATIEKELHSPLPVLRYAAAQATAELAEDAEPLLPALLPLVDDEDPEVSQAAILALGQIGGANAEKVLNRLKKSQNDMHRQAANEALAELMLGDF
jgi:HEAT repeat protein